MFTFIGSLKLGIEVNHNVKKVIARPIIRVTEIIGHGKRAIDLAKLFFKKIFLLNFYLTFFINFNYFN